MVNKATCFLSSSLLVLDELYNCCWPSRIPTKFLPEVIKTFCTDLPTNLNFVSRCVENEIFSHTFHCLVFFYDVWNKCLWRERLFLLVKICYWLANRLSNTGGLSNNHFHFFPDQRSKASVSYTNLFCSQWNSY